ncbi:MAG: GTP-binding protein [Leptolyngbyaceae cyanobacterium CRU_2_3]|nr:GTP-binding protein [Acaryochloris sp. RU_4_1]NJR64096.1 GTP-binding protein [Leptolyngbyaceae cyanobacterium CRU_2_3]
MSNKIIAVAGPLGAGKTTWICQNFMLQAPESMLYFCPGTDSVPIDSTYMAAEYPGVQILAEGQDMERLKHVSGSETVYVEIGFHLQLSSLEAVLTSLPCTRIAILPPGMEQTEWHAWADTIAVGAASQAMLNPSQLWRSPLTGQVLDPASLDMFWYELTKGAYGQVQRAKGIFDLTDGRAFHFNFVAGLLQMETTELKLPRWLKGRPDRFSGIEVVGENLDQSAIAQTLKDCGLEDRAIAYYQQQVKDVLASGAEAA